MTPHGKRSGDIRINGVSLEDMSQRDQAAKVGFVMQNPDDQIVTDKVWHELAFGLESLGCDQKTMRARVAEMACYFGIQDWFHRDVCQPVRRTEAAAQSGVHHGHAAGDSDSGRTHQPA